MHCLLRYITHGGFTMELGSVGLFEGLKKSASLPFSSALLHVDIDLLQTSKVNMKSYGPTTRNSLIGTVLAAVILHRQQYSESCTLLRLFIYVLWCLKELVK